MLMENLNKTAMICRRDICTLQFLQDIFCKLKAASVSRVLSIESPYTPHLALLQYQDRHRYHVHLYYFVVSQLEAMICMIVLLVENCSYHRGPIKSKHLLERHSLKRKATLIKGSYLL